MPSTALDRRTEIVEAARRLIVERGLEGLRFGDVARAVGINNGTLLYYFPSKEALIQAVGALLVEHFSTTSTLPAQRAALPPLDLLEDEFQDGKRRLNETDGLVYTELLVRAQRDDAVASMLRHIDAGWHASLTPMLERGRTDGTFRPDLDVDLAARLIMTTIRGIGMQALIDRNVPAAEQAMQAAFEMLRDSFALRRPA